MLHLSSLVVDTTFESYSVLIGSSLFFFWTHPILQQYWQTSTLLNYLYTSFTIYLLGEQSQNFKLYYLFKLNVIWFICKQVNIQTETTQESDEQAYCTCSDAPKLLLCFVRYGQNEHWYLGCLPHSKFTRRVKVCFWM